MGKDGEHLWSYIVHIVNIIKRYSERVNNNNNQAFYSHASWDRLEMKPHEPKKKGTKQERKRRENKGR
jgi:hypothetical protein